MRRLKQALLLPWAGGAGASSLLTGLAAYWKMDEVSGDRVDTVGGFTLTDTNTVTSNTGKQALAAEFTAANSEKLSVASAAALQGGARDWSFDCWIFIGSITGTHFILTKGVGTSGTTHEYGLFSGGAGLNWRVSCGSVEQSLLLTAGLLINTWYYVAMGYETATKTSWAQLNNNAALASTAFVAQNNTTAADLIFGTWTGNSSYFDGRIDEVGRWNRLLTGAERLARYNGGAGNTHPFS